MTGPELVQAVIGLSSVMGPAAVWMSSRLKSTLDGLRNEIAQCEAARGLLAQRVSALEELQAGDVPRWVKDHTGRLLSVSSEFVRLFGAPLGYAAADMIGRTFEELTRFSPALREKLVALDHLALQHRYAAASHVEIHADTFATVLKAVQAGASGDVLYVGYAVPEIPEAA